MRCGPAPEVEKTSVTREVQFYRDEVEYRRAEELRHALHALRALRGTEARRAADGPKSFAMRCTSSELFTEPRQCQAISCGPPPVVQRSTLSPVVDEMRYTQDVEYT